MADGGIHQASSSRGDENSKRYSVNLLEEEAPNGVGHTIRRHVGKTDAELIEAMERNTFRGWLFDFIDYREGTFKSTESANDFVNRVLERNRAVVDLVARGDLEEYFLEERFGSVTGREARRATGEAEPYLRVTYGVAVLIRHDSRSNRGYRVYTAYPKND